MGRRFLAFYFTFGVRLMSKRHISFVIVICIIILMTSCTSTDRSLSLALCGSYAVPGMFCADLKGGSFSCEILETDSKGRILYEYTAENIVTGDNDTALVICQKIDADYVFYYEDICYLLSEYSAQEIEQLKTANDWDSPLDSGKMSKRANKISYDLVIIPDNDLEYVQVRQACLKKMQINAEQIKELCILDADNCGSALYLLVTENNTDEQTYIVIVDPTYHISSLEIKDKKIDPLELASFKQTSGWSSGN